LLHRCTTTRLEDGVLVCVGVSANFAEIPRPSRCFGLPQVGIRKSTARLEAAPQGDPSQNAKAQISAIRGSSAEHLSGRFCAERSPVISAPALSCRLAQRGHPSRKTSSRVHRLIASL